jgi:hypothetical protein
LSQLTELGAAKPSILRPVEDQEYVAFAFVIIEIDRRPLDGKTSDVGRRTLHLKEQE